VVRAARYRCEGCGAVALRWEGQCRSCGQWNTLVEAALESPGRGRRRREGPPVSTEPLLLADSEEADRLPTGLGELDRVLGGGLVPGSVVILGGEPGIGKSTLLLQASAGIVRYLAPKTAGLEAAASDGRWELPLVLYVTGEETARQVRLRARRLGVDQRLGAAIEILAGDDVDRVCRAVEGRRFALLVVDSVQSLRTPDVDAPAGSLAQVREVALRLQRLAKERDLTVLLVGHVTKEGLLAGPRTLEHLVDVVLSLEGQRGAPLRLLRALKNRFGSTDEVGVLELGEEGLTAVDDPGRAFLGAVSGAPGSVVAPLVEGSRPILVEVQALVAPAVGPPRRVTGGIDLDRLNLVLAVLARRAGIALGPFDVYASLAGGLAVNEPGLDLPLAVAIASSRRDRPVRPGTVVVGEVGLLGELRPVSGLERRLREVARLGFRRAIVPAGGALPRSPEELEVVRAADLPAALAAALGPAGRVGQEVGTEAGQPARPSSSPPSVDQGPALPRRPPRVLG
jgi:DNA repair protein RadA/Sms